MKARLSAILALIATLAFFAAALAPIAVVSTFAQDPLPPAPDPQRFPLPPGEPRLNAPGDPYQTADGLWVMPGGAESGAGSSIASPQATGGPDEYGYTWNDAVPFSWIDATVGGADTGMSGDSRGLGVGPISLPFPFKYYENTYTSVHIAASGYLGFTNYGYWSGQGRLPAPSQPNNVIAPYWTPIYLSSSGPIGRVYYKSGGAPPNRYFVVEWYDVKGGPPDDDIGRDDTFRFEVVLYENGDIVFQYQTMTYMGNSWWCGVGGIEDSSGLDGLAYVSFCGHAPSNKAVRFYRPAPSARVKVYPLNQGGFTRAGEMVAFQVSIRNTGELGADTYDLTTASTWPASLYAADGTTPLTDTDGDFTVDTGSVAQGGSVTIVAEVQTPALVSGGDDNIANLLVTSSLNLSKSKTATLQTAIPAPFAQVFNDYADGAMSLYLAQPAGQSLRKVTANGYYGLSAAVAEMPSGNFVYTWSKSDGVPLSGEASFLDAQGPYFQAVLHRKSAFHPLQGHYPKYRSLGGGGGGVYEIEYALVNRYGETVRDVSKLTNNSGAAVNTYDSAPAVAAASNGRIGILWYRYLYDGSNSQFNYNIYFAILDASGNLVYGPANLTNNNAWGTFSALNVPRFFNPRIAATGDNRFVLAWQRQHYGAPTGGCTSFCSVDDIYYAVRDTSGAQVKAIAKVTNDTVGFTDAYYYAALTHLSGNRALLAWYRGGDYDIYYAVLGSDGGILKAATNLVGDGTSLFDYRPDAVQLSNGRTVIAWTSGWYPNYRIRFAVLDASYNRIAGPTTLNNPAAIVGNDSVSVAADAAGHAILTWMDFEFGFLRNLYYALVDGNGAQVTPPMIFRTSQSSSPLIQTSYEGYGNTSYSWTPPSGVDGVASFGGSLFGGAPGGVATIGVGYANHGASVATSTVLTATLDSNLTYQSDTSGIVPTVSGNNVVWNLPDIELLEEGQFTLRVNLPVAAIGTRYPITLTLASAGSEANPADNTASAEVMVARQVFLPVVLRNSP